LSQHDEKVRVQFELEDLGGRMGRTRIARYLPNDGFPHRTTEKGLSRQSNLAAECRLDRGAKNDVRFKASGFTRHRDSIARRRNGRRIASIPKMDSAIHRIDHFGR